MKLCDFHLPLKHRNKVFSQYYYFDFFLIFLFNYFFFEVLPQTFSASNWAQIIHNVFMGKFLQIPFQCFTNFTKLEMNKKNLYDP